MRAIRFSVKGMLAGVVVIAVGCVALINASRLWVSIVALLTSIILLTAVVGAIYRSGRRRAFWIGFAIFGWGYIALAYGPGSFSEVVPSSGLRYLGGKLGANANIYVVFVGKVLLALLFAVIGGFTSAYFYATRERPETTYSMHGHSPGHKTSEEDR